MGIEDDGRPFMSGGLPALLRSENFHCADCRTREYADCSIASDIWNRIASPNERLCPDCIESRLARAGIRDVECRFYYVGKCLRSASYDDALAAELRELRKDRARLDFILGNMVLVDRDDLDAAMKVEG